MLDPGNNSSTYQREKGVAIVPRLPQLPGLEGSGWGRPGTKLSHEDVRTAQRGWESAEAKFSVLVYTLGLTNMADKPVPSPSHPAWKQPCCLQGDFHFKHSSAMEPWSLLLLQGEMLWS